MASNVSDSVAQTVPGQPTTARTSGATKRRLEDLPAPRAWSLVGNLFELDPKPLHAQLEKWGEQLGSTYTFKLGPKRILVTSNVDMVLSVLKDRPARFRRLHDGTGSQGDGRRRCLLVRGRSVAPAARSRDARARPATARELLSDLAVHHRSPASTLAAQRESRHRHRRAAASHAHHGRRYGHT